MLGWKEKNHRAEPRGVPALAAVVPARFQLLHGKHAGVQVQKYLLGCCLLCFFIIIIIIFTQKGSNCLPGIAVAGWGSGGGGPGAQPWQGLAPGLQVGLL